MRGRWLLVCALLALWPGLAAAQEWRLAAPDFAWEFPRDHWSHPGYKTEWWYFTGQLQAEGDSTRRFGYQFTFFRVGVSPVPLALASTWAMTDLVMGHLAISDPVTGKHWFAEVVWRANGVLGGFGQAPDPRIAWSRGPTGTAGTWKLEWRDGGFAFRAVDARQGIALDLATVSRKPLVFQGPNGFSAKTAGSASASLYYSQTRLATTGTVEVEGERFRVVGESWMDKEFGSNQLGAEQVGWDWFSLRLDDGRDLMVYQLRDSTGAVDYASATVVDAAGQPTYLGATSFELAVTDHWTSPATAAGYPSGWRLRVPGSGLDLTIVPEMAAQENVSRLIPNLFYWEGSVRVLGPSGQPSGRGYVELTGYGKGARPAI